MAAASNTRQRLCQIQAFQVVRPVNSKSNEEKEKSLLLLASGIVGCRHSLVFVFASVLNGTVTDPGSTFPLTK